jgi:mRNA interferase HigB
MVQAARWRSFSDAKQSFGKRVDSFPLGGKKPTATVFDIAGNKYRLATLVDYTKGVIFIKRVMTHPEYDQQGWHHDFYDRE